MVPATINVYRTSHTQILVVVLNPRSYLKQTFMLLGSDGETWEKTYLLSSDVRITWNEVSSFERGHIVRLILEQES